MGLTFLSTPFLYYYHPDTLKSNAYSFPSAFITKKLYFKYLRSLMVYASYT